MANIEVRDGDNTEKHLKATGAGTIGDPFIPEHLDTNSAAMLTALQIIDNMISGSEAQVDVLTLPALPAGTNNIGDVDVLSIAAGDNNIGNVDIVTMPNVTIGAAIPAGTNNIGDVDVLTLPALPAGTNNIGDVDVLSIAAGETHIGQVGSNDDVIDVTLSLDTSAYADLDVLADTQSVSSVARVNAGVVILESITVIDEDDQKQGFTLIFLDTNNSLGTENSPPNISDANARQILGFVKILAADYVDLGGVSIACIRGIGLEMKAAAGVTTMYVGAILNGTGTYTASGIKLKLGFLRD